MQCKQSIWESHFTTTPPSLNLYIKFPVCCFPCACWLLRCLKRSPLPTGSLFPGCRCPTWRRILDDFNYASFVSSNSTRPFLISLFLLLPQERGGMKMDNWVRFCWKKLCNNIRSAARHLLFLEDHHVTVCLPYQPGTTCTLPSAPSG